MSPDSGSAGYIPRLLSAAAFITSRASEESLAELRLTQERTMILGLLSASPADEAALATASGLAADCVRECTLALQGCGYATSGPGPVWRITPEGAAIQAKALDAESRLMSRSNDDVAGLRRELHALIQALTPRPDAAGPQ